MVAFIKKQYALIIALLFFTGTFFLSIRPLLDYDLWFDLKSGEVFSKMGIINYDVFSYTESGKQWFPYEWLFQVMIYNMQQIFGFLGIRYFVALMAVVQIGLLFVILKKIFHLSSLRSIIILLFFLASIFDFFVARPFLVAYPLLMVNLMLILLYFFQKKNLLWISLPVTLIWANLHGSIFLDIFFFLGYSCIAGIQYLLSHHKDWIERSRTLFFYAVATVILTILPPLGFTQYQLLWKFFQERTILTRYIAEWTPLASDQLMFTIYTATLVTVVGLLLFVLIKKRNYKAFLWIIPLIPLTASAYLAGRNVYLGYLAFSLMLAFIFKYIGRKILLIITIIVIIYSIFLLQEKMQAPKFYYPVAAAKFIRQYHLQGNMFNEYAYGGYLLWSLYPEQKVFIDGRSDVYIDREMPETLGISINKNMSDEKFRAYMYKGFFDKYHMSFAILRTEKNTVLRKIGRILDNDPQWSLVLWDDTTELFVRKDGKNDEIIKEFGTTEATPYLQTPFPPGKADAALLEYVRMDQLVKSAHTSNAIGFILLQKGQYDNAKQRFLEAISIDPNFESPYMNLAELAARDGNLDNAISLYQKAKTLAPDRGLIYIRLGQLTLEKTQDIDQAKQIWADGVKNTADKKTKKQLQNLLSNN